MTVGQLRKRLKGVKSDTDIRIAGPGGAYRVLSAGSLVNPKGEVVFWLEVSKREGEPDGGGPWTSA